jgi:8-oxo-dGTP diphosphatase
MTAPEREYPGQPMIGVGGIVVREGRALLVRRGSEPLKGQWSIPGGLLEVGETLEAGVRRELLEETGLHVRVLRLVGVYERIIPAEDGRPGPRFHFVILDYLCEAESGIAVPGSDAAELAFVSEQELPRYGLSEEAACVVRQALKMVTGYRVPI